MEGIFLLATSLTLFYLAIKTRLKTKSVVKSGITVEGTVFDTVESDFNTSRVKYPVIRFSTLENESITEEYENNVMSGFFKKGKKVYIIYNPKNPKEFIVKSAGTSAVPTILITLATIIFGSGIYKLLHIQF